jgi:hypothetical protein
MNREDDHMKLLAKSHNINDRWGSWPRPIFNANRFIGYTDTYVKWLDPKEKWSLERKKLMLNTPLVSYIRKFIKKLFL